MVEEIDQRFKQNLFCSLIQTSSIFNLCLIIEEIIDNKNTNIYRKPFKYFSDQLEFLLSRTSLGLTKGTLEKINNNSNDDFEATLTDLLKPDPYTLNNIILTPIEEDIAIAHVFRNFGAHNIESHKIIYEKYDEITSRILNTLFFPIEKLYPF